MKTTEKKLLSNEEIASFCSQAAMLFQAGIPPVEGMAILQSDAQSPEGKAIFEEILTVCRQGESFHKALEATKVFPDYCLHMIALGEESGNLDVCMSSLADYYEKEDAIAGSIRDAVTYPFIMIAMMAAVIVVLVSRVMPIFEQVYIELGSEMTGFAASLLRLGNHLNRYSFIFVSILCILLLLYLFATRTQTGKRVTARFLNWFPLTRRFYESVACERFSSGMALTLSSGMDTYSSLDMVAALVGNEKMKQKILSCKEAINAGANFAEALTGVVRMRAEPANMRQAHRPRHCAPRETQGDRSDHSMVIKQRKHRMIVEMLRHACQIGGGRIKLNPERFNGRVGGQHQRQIIVFIIQRQTPEMVRHNPCSSGELR